MKNWQKFALIGVALIGFVGSEASSCDTHSNAPEPTNTNIVDGTHTQVIRMPDGYRNVVFTCYGTQGVYVTSRGAGDTSGVFVMANDPHCVG